MGDERWLTGGLVAACPASGLPEGEAFRLDPLDEAPGLGPFPGPLIAAAAPAAGNPPALAGKPVALADDQHRQLRLAAKRPGLVDRAENLAERPHLRPREGIAELLEQLAIAERRPRLRGGDEVQPNVLGLGECHRPPSVAVADRQASVGAAAVARTEAQPETVLVALLDAGDDPAIAFLDRALQAEAVGPGRVAVPGGDLVDRVGRGESDLDLAVAALVAAGAGGDGHPAQGRARVEKLAVAIRPGLVGDALGQADRHVDAGRLERDLPFLRLSLRRDLAVFGHVLSFVAAAVAVAGAKCGGGGERGAKARTVHFLSLGSDRS